MTLNELPVGRHAKIIDVEGNDGVAVRLMEMGLTEDEVITLVGFAPMGDPIEFQVRGYRLSLRIAEAKRVTIAPVDG